ncbi:MAG: S1 RNA-binding domain-containing protein [Thermostichales cyanobacterium BF4_bins_65]
MSNRPPRRVSQTFSSEDFAKLLDQQTYSFEPGQVVQGKVVSHDTLQGVFVDCGGKNLGIVPPQEVSLYAVADPAVALPEGSQHEFLVIRGQDADGQILLSRRRLELNLLWEDLVNSKTHNQPITVRVAGVNRGGVTVNVKGLRGFIPRSQLLERDNLEALVGQKITVSFLEVDPSRNKIVLSQRLAAQTTLLEEYSVGSLVSGTVAAIKPFGLIVQFGESSGLIHIKQVSQSYVKDLSQHFQVGQPLKAVITDLDLSKGRISLSMRLLEKQPGEVLTDLETLLADAENRLDQVRTKLSRGENTQP